MSLPDWLKEFADKELQKGGNPFDDIKNLFKSRNDLDAVEARVEELREQVGLDLIEKMSTIRQVEKAKERGKGTTTKWCVYPKHGGKSLGCHSTEAEAKKQLSAIEINKADDFCIKEVPADIAKSAKEKPYYGPIEKQTLKNKNYRKVLFTGQNSQLVLMNIKGGQDIGLEVHKDVDQFFRIEEGEAIFVLDGKKKRIKADEAVIVPAGTQHNVINASDTEPLKLYTIYSPPEHPAGTVEKTKAEEGKKEKVATLLRLIAFAQALEDEGLSEMAQKVDERIGDLGQDMLAKDKEIKDLPEKYQKYKGLDEFIQNACRTSGGHALVPAIQDRIRKEFDEEIDIKNKDLEAYIKHCLEKHKEKVSEEDEHAGEYIAVIVTEDDDGNKSVFDEPNGIR